MQASIYRLEYRDLLTLCVLALLGLGALMVQSASFVPNGDTTFGLTTLGAKQLVYAGIGLAVYLSVGFMNYRKLLNPSREQLAWWRHPIVAILLLAVLACTLVLVPHIGKEVNGARRWLVLGSIQVQPSELAKWASVIFLAWWLTARPVPLERFFKGFIPTLIPVGLLCLLVVVQDFGTAVLIGVCALAMLLAGRVKLWHLLVSVPPVAVGAMWFIMHKQYRWHRMTAFLDPYASPRGDGYHMIQSLLSFSTGGLFGRGLGNGIQKLGYLPEDTTDFIFSVICEELGAFGALLVIALYLCILFVAWQVIKKRTYDPFGRMLAFGISAMIGLQAAINIAVATVSVPTKGMSLPLVSAGGSGLIITCAALGLLYSVCRTSQREASPTLYRMMGDAPVPAYPVASH